VLSRELGLVSLTAHSIGPNVPQITIAGRPGSGRPSNVAGTPVPTSRPTCGAWHRGASARADRHCYRSLKASCLGGVPSSVSRGSPEEPAPVSGCRIPPRAIVAMRTERFRCLGKGSPLLLRADGAATPRGGNQRCEPDLCRDTGCSPIRPDLTQTARADHFEHR
jgi:hypothetical protein